MKRVQENWFDGANTSFSFQCENDISDLQIYDNFVLAGTYNGDVEVWDMTRGRRMVRMRDQLGMVQIRTNGVIIVGISDDSTVNVWTFNGELLKQFHHHKASVYGLVVTEQHAVTGCMLGQMAVIDLQRMDIE